MITCRELGRLGRMGNMLFQIAGCIGIARKSGQNFAFPKLICHDMIERFGSKEDPELYKYLINPLPEISVEEINRIGFQRSNYFWEWKDGMMERELFLPHGNWDMYAHFQSVKFFDHCIDEIRHYFTFKDECKQNIRTAIHFRAGDYISDQSAYHPRCTKEYYQEAMDLIEDQRFLLFTDDYEAWKEMFPEPNNIDYMCYGYNYIEDFKLMKSCKSFICANSSFSHMAALLGTHPEKKIIMPKKWFGSQAGGLNFDTLYPQNAIIL